MVIYQTKIWLTLIILGIYSCTEFPFPYKEKEKNFEPTAKIIFPNHGDTISYADSGYIIATINDIDNINGNLKINWTSDIDGPLNFLFNQKYGQSIVLFKSLSYNAHNISVSVNDEHNEEIIDEIEINYNKPDKVSINDISDTNQGIKIVWTKSLLPSSVFNKYAIIKRENDLSGTTNIKLAEILTPDDTTFYYKYYNFFPASYSIKVYDVNGKSSTSDIKSFHKIISDSISFNNYSDIRQVKYDNVNNILYVISGEVLFFIDINSNRIIDEFYLEETRHFDINEDHTALYITQGLTILKFDLLSKSVTNTYNVGDYTGNYNEEYVNRVLCGKEGRLFFTQSYSWDDVFLIDTETKALLDIITYPNSIDRCKLSISRDRNTLFAGGSFKIYKYDISNDTFSLLRENYTNGGSKILTRNNSVYFGGVKFDFETLDYIWQTGNLFYLVSLDEKMLISYSHIIDGENVSKIQALPFESRVSELSNDAKKLFLYNDRTKYLHIYNLKY